MLILNVFRSDLVIGCRESHNAKTKIKAKHNKTKQNKHTGVLERLIKER